MDPRYIEAVLEWQIAAIDAELAALQPRGWPVPPLGKSFLDGAVSEALGGLWESEIDRGRAAYAKALDDHAYGQKKLDHFYI